MANRPSVTEIAEQHRQAAELLKRDREAERLRLQIKALESKYKQAIADLEAADERADFWESFDEARASAWENDQKSAKPGEYCAIVSASDWHIGERVDPGTVRGLNHFDETEAERRVRKFFLKIPEYCERYAPDAKTVYLWAGGDFISGQIHEELRENNSRSATQECLWLRELWNNGLATLLKEMPRRRLVIPSSYGNHGRTTVKPRSSTASQNSYEQMTYHVMARDWQKETRVRWAITDGYHNVLTICGRKVRFHHGDAIKFGGGVGGITIPVRKAIAQWNKSERCDLDVFGHFHEYLDGGHFVCNGSLVGYGPFSVRIKAEYQPPIQAFLVFDRKHGLRQSTRIFVAD